MKGLLLLCTATNDGRASVVQRDAETAQSRCLGARGLLIPDHLPDERQPAAAEQLRPRKPRPTASVFSPLPFQIELAHWPAAAGARLAQGVGDQPVAHFLPERVIFRRKLEIHCLIS